MASYFTQIIGNGNRVFGQSMGSGVAGSGILGRVHRPLPAFDRVVLNGSLELVVQHGPTTEAVIEADNNLLELIDLRVEDTTLIVGLKPNVSFSSQNRMSVLVSSLQVVSADLNGSGTLTLEGLDQAEVELTLKGSGDLIADGAVERARIKLMGSGDVRAKRLTAQRLSAHLIGSGDLKACAVQEVEGALIGSGDLTITGAPHTRHVSKSGSGDISFR